MLCPVVSRGHLCRRAAVDILAHGEVVEQVITLKDHANVAPWLNRPVLSLHRVRGLIAKPVFSLPLIVEQSENI